MCFHDIYLGFRNEEMASFQLLVLGFLFIKLTLISATIVLSA